MVPTMSPTRNRLASCRRPTGVVLAVSNSQQSDMLQRVLRRMGVPVQLANSAAEVRQHLAESPGQVAILGPDLTDESCWLTCAKLTQPPARATVLIVAPDTPRHRMMARAAGAAALISDPVAIADWLPPVRSECCN